MPKKIPKVAYFSMEYALKPEIPNFAGGLGVLATDILSSASDLGKPVVGVSLIYHMDDDREKAFDFDKHFEELPETIVVQIEDRQVVVKVWKYEIKGAGVGKPIPLYLLSTYHPDNKPWDRDITRYLYSVDPYTRLCQEVVLGIGGVRMLRKLGHTDIDIFHMNEGHASLLTLERLKEERYDEEKVRQSCCFTTHTPIPAGHDHFDYNLAYQVTGPMLPWNIRKLASAEELHTTKLALSLSKFSNGVSTKHQEVCHGMFKEHQFLGVTNGVHHDTWVKGEMRELFDRHMKGWQRDPSLFGKALDLPDQELKKAHRSNKQALVDFINARPEYFVFEGEPVKDDFFDADTLTITFSRRFVPYKRPLLLFSELKRLRQIGYRKIQVIYSGKCHPSDEFCNNVMAELRQFGFKLRGQIRIAVMTDRNLDTSALLAAGSDIWLNNPVPPLEASGTSGMKAAMNGCINLSTPDGWWLEADKMDPMSGWTFGSLTATHSQADADALYEALAKVVDVYENHPMEWLGRMKHSIALGAYFNTDRCVEEYYDKMWSAECLITDQKCTFAKT